MRILALVEGEDAMPVTDGPQHSMLGLEPHPPCVLPDPEAAPLDLDQPDNLFIRAASVERGRLV